MNNREMMDLYESITSKMFDNIDGSKFNYCLIKNEGIIEGEIKTIRGNIIKFQNGGAYKKIQEEIQAMFRECCEKDDKDNPKINELGNLIFPDEGLINKNIAEIEAKDPEFLVKKNQLNKEYDELLKNEMTVELFKLDWSNVPDNLTKPQIKAIEPLLIES